MASPSVAGDLTLAARVAAAETFAPFGRLLAAGDRVTLGARGGTVLALDRAQPGPRRVTHMQRYPEARRVFLPLGPGSLLLVVLPPGERPGGPPSAFIVPSGHGVLLKEGVWHAGPTPLAELPVVELLETTGPVDRLDRRALADLVGSDGARVVLPEDPGARPPGLDLTQPNAVLLDPVFSGRVRLACLDLRDLEVGEGDAGLLDEGERLAQALRGTAGGAAGLDRVNGVAQARALFRGLGIDPEALRPSSEALLQHVLEGHALPRVNALVDTVTLWSLKTRLPIGVYDAQRVAEHVLVRLGGPGEGFTGLSRQRVVVEGRPVLCDREGPFGGPVGDSLRTRATSQTRRAFVVLYLAPSVEPAAAESLLTGLSSALRGRCGGHEAARLCLG